MYIYKNINYDNTNIIIIIIIIKQNLESGPISKFIINEIYKVINPAKIFILSVIIIYFLLN